jgi:hypothetical protein
VDQHWDAVDPLQKQQVEAKSPEEEEHRFLAPVCLPESFQILGKTGAGAGSRNRWHFRRGAKGLEAFVPHRRNCFIHDAQPVAL